MLANEEQLDRRQRLVEQGEIESADLRLLGLEEAGESRGQQRAAG
jgi:hypothetical protein